MHIREKFSCYWLLKLNLIWRHDIFCLFWASNEKFLGLQYIISKKKNRVYNFLLKTSIWKVLAENFASLSHNRQGFHISKICLRKAPFNSDWESRNYRIIISPRGPEWLSSAYTGKQYQCTAKSLTLPSVLTSNFISNWGRGK